MFVRNTLNDSHLENLAVPKGQVNCLLRMVWFEPSHARGGGGDVLSPIYTVYIRAFEQES